MVEKLRLPFPMLSDPDRSGAITPYRLADPKDHREIATPALVLIEPGGVERWRFVSRDYADRLPEDEVIRQSQMLGLAPVTQEPIENGRPEPGPRAMPAGDLRAYFRGARFAALAMGVRHRHHDDSIKEDSKAYVEEMDRYLHALEALGL